MNIQRRAILGGISALAALPLSARFALASSDPITLIVPYSAGSGIDGISRVLADGLSKEMGRSFLVDNKPGANGIIGAQYVAGTKNPQNTLFVGGTGPLSLNVLMRRTLPFKLEDFKSVSYVSNGPLAVTVPVSSGLNTFEEFVERAKAAEKPLRFGTFGPGSLSQVFGAILQQEFGFAATEVSYKATSEEVRDILGGQVDFTVSSPLGVLGQINAGTMKMLALAGEERMERLPDVRTFKEMGYPQVTTNFWTGLFAPKGMDDALVTQINAAMEVVLKQDTTLEFLDKIGQFVVGGAPSVMDEQLASDKEQFGAVIEARGIRID